MRDTKNRELVGELLVASEEKLLQRLALVCSRSGVCFLVGIIYVACRELDRLLLVSDAFGVLDPIRPTLSISNSCLTSS